MYAFVDKELEQLGLERKFIRHEMFGEFHNPSSQPDYPAGVPETVKITVTQAGETRTVEGSSNDSVLQILEKNGIREKVKIATKLPQYMIASRAALDKYFEEQFHHPVLNVVRAKARLTRAARVSGPPQPI